MAASASKKAQNITKKQVWYNNRVNLTPGGAGYPSVMFRVRLKD